MGGIPTNYWGEVLNPTKDDPDATVPGLMAVGEAGCASVHGANRLGSNSLIDLVVFGRAAAIRAAEVVDPSSAIPDVPRASMDFAMTRFDKIRHGRWRHAHGRASSRDAADHAGPTPPSSAPTRRWPKAWRKKMQGVAGKMDDLHVTDRSLIWNSDLMEDAGADQPHAERDGNHRLGRGAQGKPRGSCARGLSGSRRRQLAQALAGRSWMARRSISTSAPVHLNPLIGHNEGGIDLDRIKPKARVY